jgi:hypothetical protein
MAAYPEPHKSNPRLDLRCLWNFCFTSWHTCINFLPVFRLKYL